MKKQASGMLQAADLLVWQYSKYIKDLTSGRKPRKDFMALTEKPIAFTHIWNESGTYITFNQFDDSDLYGGDCRRFLTHLYFTNDDVEHIRKISNAWTLVAYPDGSVREV